MRLRLMYDIEVARATVDVSESDPLPDDREPPLESEEDARKREPDIPSQPLVHAQHSAIKLTIGNSTT